MTDAQQSREATARKLIYLRKNQGKGKSQAQIAKKIGIPRTRYASYELARAIVPYSVIKSLCGVYCITLDRFEEINITPKTKA
jgi:transcriptional regulator with XRE-family HTH domain